MTTLTVNDLRFEVRRSSLRRALEITVDRGGELILSAPPKERPRYAPSLWNSLAATSRASAISSPGLRPAFSIAFTTRASTSSALLIAGAKPPSSPTVVASPCSLMSFLSWWNVSAPHCRASAKVRAPQGTIMNSCTSLPLSACAPPLITFMSGTGSVQADTPPR